MTRAELVKKLTSYAVVDDAYAASFMETFLMLLHQRLHEYDTFILPSKISFSQQKIVRNNEDFYLITCTSINPADTPSEDLVFAVPNGYDEKKQDKYSVFSISIGKQIIPTKEMITSGFAFEPSFSVKNYFRDKAENLLESGKFESNKSASSDFAWNFISSESENQFSSDESLQEEISKEVQEFTWDFGNNWKRELHEEEILSIEPSLEDVIKHTFVQGNFEEKEESPGWNFGEDVEPISSETEDESKLQPQIEEVDFSKLHEDFGYVEPSYDYQEVKSKTQEFSIDLSEFDKMFEPETQEEEPENSLQDDEIVEHEHTIHDYDYTHVQSTSEFVLTHEQENLLAETDPFSNFTVERTPTEFEHYKGDSTWQESITSFPPENPIEDEYQLPEEETTEENETPFKKEKTNKFWAMASAALIIFIFIFLYWKMWGIPNWLKLKSQTEQLVKNKPTVLEREYDIPVTYPYEVKITETPKLEQGIDNKINSSLSANLSSTTEKLQVVKNEVDASDLFSKNNPNNQIGKKIKQTQTQEAPSKPKTVEVKEPIKKKEVIKEKLPENKKTVLIRDNIYLEGSSYIVQLSSWKSEAIADQEVARLQKRGIKAFKTSVVIPQKRGTWYRVKVGGFSSAEEASRFYNSIK
ncbi:MAG: SPOR domain-containing protein [Ignavibacteriaceae bacterium]